MKFVNRENELKHLEEEFSNKGARFTIIYGRRRIGKTRLIEEFIKNKKSIYYLAAQEEDRLQIEEFKRAILRQITDEYLDKTYFKNWTQFFSYLEKIWPKEEQIILAIDEVTFIIKENLSFTSYLQKFWDKFLSRTNTFLILSGSLVGLMLESVLSYESPLYGRRTSQIHLEEFRFSESKEFMLPFSIEEQIKFFSVTGGVPKYLLLIEKVRNFKEFLLRKLFSKEGFFYNEGLFLLSQEFKEPSTYINILKAISHGNSKLNEISNFTGFETKKISRYLDILIRLNLINKEIPITENEKRFRGAIYLLNDNFLAFWHRFINRNRSLIESRKGEEIIREEKNQINAYIGLMFEKICREFIKDKFPLFKIGRWWGHYRDEDKKRQEIEIDIAALNEDNKKILFCECKWQDKVDAPKILNELKDKSAYVDWNNSRRKEYFAVFAKSFKKKFKEKNVYLFDLKDIEKIIK